MEPHAISCNEPTVFSPQLLAGKAESLIFAAPGQGSARREMNVQTCHMYLYHSIIISYYIMFSKLYWYVYIYIHTL